jgi:hypothetical protein
MSTAGLRSARRRSRVGGPDPHRTHEIRERRTWPPRTCRTPARQFLRGTRPARCEWSLLPTLPPRYVGYEPSRAKSSSYIAAPSMDSRMMSACPAWRANSSMMCNNTHRHRPLAGVRVHLADVRRYFGRSVEVGLGEHPDGLGVLALYVVSRSVRLSSSRTASLFSKSVIIPTSDMGSSRGTVLTAPPPSESRSTP